MKAVVFSHGEVVWHERPDPVPGPDEILVRVEAAGINRADLAQRAGHYPPPAGVPADQPGIECAGIAEAVGAAVRTCSPGDRVMGLLAGAGQAELALLHQRAALAIPSTMSGAEAGGFPEVFATAYDALFSQAHLALGERLLVTGAAGGVGTAAVQLGVCAGAQVVATARDLEAHRLLRDLGAIPAIPSAASAHGPFDVVLELVGGSSVPESLSQLATWGRIVVIGTGAGSRCELDLGQLMSRRATVRGSTLRTRSLEEKALVARGIEHHVLPLFERGSARVVVEATFPFEKAQEAYERFAAGRKVGKIVLTHL